MPDLWVHQIASAVRTTPDYWPPSAFRGDRWLSGMTDAVGAAAASIGVPDGALSYLPDVPDNDVAEQALALLGPPRSPQPLYVSRSGGETDPFAAMLPRLVRTREWVSDALVLTHLEALTGSAVFDFLSWALDERQATVLLVDQQVVALDYPPDALTAVALRTGTTGARVVAWGVGSPSRTQRCRVFHGTRGCDAWFGFAQALAAGEIAVDDTVVLHTVGDPQEGWVRLYLDQVPFVVDKPRP